MSDISRLSTLIHQIRAYFRVDSKDNIIGVQVSKDDMNSAVAPDNIIIGEGVKKIVVSSTPPASPETGDIWIDIS